MYWNPAPSGKTKEWQNCEGISLGLSKILTTESLRQKKYIKSDYDIIKPIILTEEWLFNFNCQKIKEGHFWWGRFELIFKHNYGYWYITSDGTSGNNYFSEVEFVHEWQNLVFAMDGTQLKLKSQS